MRLSASRYFIMLLVCGCLPADLLAQATLEQRVLTLEKELKALKASAQAHQQAQEDRAFKRVIDEVIEDAKKRQITSGVFAGYDGDFILRALEQSISEEGKASKGKEAFLLSIHGHFQFRHIVNHQNGRADETESGFHTRSAKLGIKGHVHTPMQANGKSQKIRYSMTVGTGRSTGNVFLIAYSIRMSDIFGSGVEVSMGRGPLPYLHAEKVLSKRQLAVERASVSEFFTADRAEQIQFKKSESLLGMPMQVAFAIHDGASTEMSEFDADPVEFGLASRTELAVVGSLKPYTDYSNKVGKASAPNLVVGAGWIYQHGDPANGNGVSGSPPGGVRGSGERQTDADADYFAWTVDAGYEQGPFGIFAAVMGGHTYARYDAQSATNREMYGVLAQSRYNLKHLIGHDIEPFIRYEWLNDGIAANENAQLFTAGVNWYHWGHFAKLTSDVVWFFEGDVPMANPFGAGAFGSGLGMSGIGSANMSQAFVLRTQYQLYF